MLILFLELLKYLISWLGSASPHIINTAVNTRDQAELVLLAQVLVIGIGIDHDHVRLPIYGEDDRLLGSLQLPSELCGVTLENAKALYIASNLHNRDCITGCRIECEFCNRLWPPILKPIFGPFCFADPDLTPIVSFDLKLAAFEA